MPRQEEVFDVTRMVRLARVPCLGCESFARTWSWIDAREFSSFGAIASDAVYVPLKQPADRIRFRSCHHCFDGVGVDVEHCLPLRRHSVRANAWRLREHAGFFKPENKGNGRHSCNEGATRESGHRSSYVESI